VHPLRLGELQARRRARTRYRQRLRVAARDGEAKEATAGGDGTRNIRLRAQRSTRSWRVSAARKTQSAAQHYHLGRALAARGSVDPEEQLLRSAFRLVLHHCAGARYG